MAPGQTRVDLQIAESKPFSFFDCFRAGNWFASGSKNLPTSFLAQARQVRDMIGVSMGKENEVHVQFMAVGKAHHFTAVRAGIKSRCGTTRRVPDKIGVDRHVVIMRVELREAVSLINFFRMPFAFGEFAKRLPGETQNRRNAQKGLLIKITLAQLTDFLRTDTRFFRQFGIGNAQATLRFSDDVTDVVFEWYHIRSSLAKR